MTKVLHLLLIAGLAAACTAHSESARAQSLQSVVTKDFLPASSHSTQRFTCLSEADAETDVIVEYETVFSGPGQHTSRLKGITLAGEPLPSDQLAQINQFVGTDSITNASAGCAGNDIRVSIQVFRPDSIAPTACLADGYQYIFVYLDGKTGKVRID